MEQMRMASWTVSWKPLPICSSSKQKLHAQKVDLEHVTHNMKLLRYLEYRLVDPLDPRLHNVVGILATSTAPNADLEDAARTCGMPVWLLAADGSDFHLDPLAAVAASTATPTPAAAPTITATQFQQRQADG